MIDKIRSFFEDHIPNYSTGKFLVTVSGGIDSMVLLHALHSLNLEIPIAHMNFQLRGKDSDLDEQLVRDLAKSKDIEFFSKRVVLDPLMQKEGISVQMAARRTRYDWFEKIRLDQGYDYICVAHHADDQIETVLMNQIRGTGFKGLSGMAPVSDRVIRPLLNIRRSEVEAYAKLHQVPFRHDQSNDELKYDRNIVRHKVIPALTELNPGFGETYLRNITHWKESEALLSHEIRKWKKKIAELRGNDLYIFLNREKSLPFFNLILFEILRDHGFSSDQFEQARSLIHAESGKQIQSPTHRLLKDRSFFILSSLDHQLQVNHYLEASTEKLVLADGELQIQVKDHQSETPVDDAFTATLDFEKIQYPLQVRHWRKGDYLYPLGLKKRNSDKIGKKKVSDLFIDLKIPVHQKERTWIVQSGDKIVWVIGMRLDDRFKVTPKTKRVLRIQFNPTEQ